jgi:hypothetical protein
VHEYPHGEEESTMTLLRQHGEATVTTDQVASRVPLGT